MQLQFLLYANAICWKGSIAGTARFMRFPFCQPLESFCASFGMRIIRREISQESERNRVRTIQIQLQSKSISGSSNGSACLFTSTGLSRVCKHSIGNGNGIGNGPLKLPFPAFDLLFYYSTNFNTSAGNASVNY